MIRDPFSSNVGGASSIPDMITGQVVLRVVFRWSLWRGWRGLVDTCGALRGCRGGRVLVGIYWVLPLLIDEARDCLSFAPVLLFFFSSFWRTVRWVWKVSSRLVSAAHSVRTSLHIVFKLRSLVRQHSYEPIE
ncbi:hypothetical protein CC80DRAFT_39101 [Byssothecium circinans]|uniref:Uncharacterized protein n=1 Tax=Byssothecium circinans TaxID=147558 RepID=A0A6A5TZI4_9PLEO|nr:hypothetical protein CC80DRAFT_39101 [Byssothecium circinans]